MDDFTLFYAWQSDTLQKANHYLIREALREPLTQLSAAGIVEDSTRIDHDTMGVAGTPEVAGTIFDKIKDAGLFLADVTFIGKSASGELLPNPNVLVELGFAA